LTLPCYTCAVLTQPAPSTLDLLSLHDALPICPDFLSRELIFWGLLNVVTWQWAGYYMIILYAALQGIDPTLYEAARIDGASQWQDRKSTRLNYSHVKISYAVFCLKKKKRKVI